MKETKKNKKNWGWLSHPQMAKWEWPKLPLNGSKVT
jgi:hypothetical protein